ncbi:uncharacterized protein LOC126750332 [Anthonomus grandis grandis]|uniref:uncharacterized protein LOC126750332 n=1 Tax=Anthonomus grandis grandis TaxID=2921223 RepID=UPI00216508C6|nr:uncharacterized protein LOC126750332 [Anthonomus grandis grandis]
MFCVVLLVLIVFPDQNLAEKKTTFASSNSKFYRLISFGNDGNIKIDLDFNVPFITLPIKKSMETAKNALINLNVGAVVLAGVFIFGAAVTLPIILAFFNKKGLIPSDGPFGGFYHKINQQRSEDSPVWKYLMTIDKSLMDNNVDITSCSQRMLCWAVESSSKNVANGKGSSADKIFDGLVTNRWVQENMLSSVYLEAVNSGLSGINCSQVYKMCQMNYDWLKIFINKFNGT